MAMLKPVLCRANGLTGFGKFLLFSSIIFSTAGANAQSYQSPAFDSWADNRSGAGIVYNISKWFSASLSKEDLAKHQRVVLFALNNIDPGETAVWANETTNSEGKVTLAVRYATTTGTCCRIYSYVRVNNNFKTYTDSACLDSNQKTWTFVDKY
jgi:surface antigen